MSNTVWGLGIMAVIAAVIGFMIVRGSRAKRVTGNTGVDGVWGSPNDGGHADGGGDGGGD